MTTRLVQRLIVGVLVAAAVGSAIAVHLSSTHGLQARRVGRLQVARHRVSDAVERRSYFLEDLADMVGVHDDAAAEEFSRYAHVRGRDEQAVVSVQWVRGSPTGKLIPPAAPDPNPGRTPMLIAPVQAANRVLADAAHERAAAAAIRGASLNRLVAVSAPVTLANGDPGFYLAVPVQGRRYSGLLSKAESESAIVGLVDAQTLAAEALGHGSSAFRLRDRVTPLASIGSGLHNALRAAVPIAGRRWTIAVEGGSLSAFQSTLPWVILAVGLGLASAVAVILKSAGRRRDEALRLADERLAELKVSLQRVELTNQQLAVAHADAEQRSRIDALTEIPNRRHFREMLDKQLETESASAAVLLLDLDHFKQINDEHGHVAGDVALCAVARRLESVLRDGDCVARWGGEEFAILATGIDRDSMIALAERARQRISDDPVLVDGLALSLRISAGCAMAGDGLGSADAIVDAADKALYEAKRAGRDCVRVYEPSVSFSDQA